MGLIPVTKVILGHPQKISLDFKTSLKQIYSECYFAFYLTQVGLKRSKSAWLALTGLTLFIQIVPKHAHTKEYFVEHAWATNTIDSH